MRVSLKHANSSH